MDVTKENSDKDWTKLESYIGLTPEEVIEKSKTHIHLLVLGTEKCGADVVRTFQGEFGDEAGLASICAILFYRKYGARRTTYMAAEMYEDIAKQNKNESLLERVRNLQGMFYFSCPNIKNMEWPVVYPYETPNHRAGLANVMLGISVEQLAQGSTVDLIAANGVIDFLDKGLRKRILKQVRGKEKG